MIEIRHLLPSDDPYAVSRVYEQSWKSAYRGIVPQSYLDAIPAGRWASLVAIEGWHNLVALDGEAVVGVCCFSRSRFAGYADWGEIISLYLLPAFTGAGLGRRLMERALAELRSQGYSRVFLWVLEENLPARRFYEKVGFVSNGVEQWDNIGGRDLKELMYVLETV